MCLRMGEQTLPLLSHNASDTSGNGSARPEAERDTHVLFFLFSPSAGKLRLSRILQRNRSRGAGEFNHQPAQDFPTSKKRRAAFHAKAVPNKQTKHTIKTKQNRNKRKEKRWGKSAVCQVVASRVRATYPR